MSKSRPVGRLFNLVDAVSKAILSLIAFRVMEELRYDNFLVITVIFILAKIAKSNYYIIKINF
jgi:hypothetical protein